MKNLFKSNQKKLFGDKLLKLKDSIQETIILFRNDFQEGEKSEILDDLKPIEIFDENDSNNGYSKINRYDLDSRIYKLNNRFEKINLIHTGLKKSMESDYYFFWLKCENKSPETIANFVYNFYQKNLDYNFDLKDLYEKLRNQIFQFELHYFYQKVIKETSNVPVLLGGIGLEPVLIDIKDKIYMISKLLNELNNKKFKLEYLKKINSILNNKIEIQKEFVQNEFLSKDEDQLKIENKYFKDIKDLLMFHNILTELNSINIGIEEFAKLLNCNQSKINLLKKGEINKTVLGYIFFKIRYQLSEKVNIDTKKYSDFISQNFTINTEDLTYINFFKNHVRNLGIQNSKLEIKNKIYSWFPR